MSSFATSPPPPPLPLSHVSHLTCLSFDYYGRRLASTGADQTIKVWDYVEGAEGADGANSTSVVGSGGSNSQV